LNTVFWAGSPVLGDGLNWRLGQSELVSPRFGGAECNRSGLRALLVNRGKFGDDSWIEAKKKRWLPS